MIFGQSHDDSTSTAETSDDTEPGQREQTVPSGEELNIQGVFLHVMADALGSVVVLVSASVIWLTDWEYKDYLDPVLSLLLVLLVCASTWPLLSQSALILLNCIPEHIDADALKAGLVSCCEAIRNVHELHIWQLVGRFVCYSWQCHILSTPLHPQPDHHHRSCGGGAPCASCPPE